MTQHLERLNKLSQDTKADVTLSKFELLSDGPTFVQKNAEQRFKEIIDLLNTDIAGRPLRRPLRRQAPGRELRPHHERRRRAPG